MGPSVLSCHFLRVLRQRARLTLPYRPSRACRRRARTSCPFLYAPMGPPTALLGPGRTGPGCRAFRRSLLGSESSVLVEDRLLSGDLLASGCCFLGCRVIWISNRWQAAELHQTGYQQQPSLRRGQVRAADERRIVKRYQALGIAAPDANVWKPAMYRPQHQPMPCTRNAPRRASRASNCRGSACERAAAGMSLIDPLVPEAYVQASSPSGMAVRPA